MAEPEYPREHPCPKCSRPLAFKPRPETQHFGEVRCPEHGHRWIPKPAENKKPKRKSNSKLIQGLTERQQNFCWACLRNKSLLQLLRPSVSLEVHHIMPVVQGGSDDVENLMVLCAECHAEVHRRREAFNRYRPFTSATDEDESI